MKNKRIYLDYAATTPVDPQVALTMQHFLTLDGVFANPASKHTDGEQAALAIEAAREPIAQSIGATSKNIIFTSGATEANNLALKGITEFYQRSGRHIITCQTEHKSILNSCAHLEKQGFEITYLPVNHNGLIDLSALSSAIKSETLLISIALVNNETGVIQDLAAISRIAKSQGIYLHTDATQALGKCVIDVDALGVDCLSLSAHKAYGPKGIGALYVRQQPRVRLTAQIDGGEQQQGLRGGTLPTHQIVAFGQACQLINDQFAAEQSHIEALQRRLVMGLQAIGECIIHAQTAPRVNHILNISFIGVDSDALMILTPELALATGSACTSGSIEPSHVLMAMAIESMLALGAIRLSFGRFTTIADVDQALVVLARAVNKIRSITPAGNL